jgi:hypothetical protein
MRYPIMEPENAPQRLDPHRVSKFKVPSAFLMGGIVGCVVLLALYFSY